jgi:hypothetical protein
MPRYRFYLQKNSVLNPLLEMYDIYLALLNSRQLHDVTHTSCGAVLRGILSVILMIIIIIIIIIKGYTQIANVWQMEQI